MTPEEILRQKDVILQYAAKSRFCNYVKYVKPQLDMTHFHKVYYEVLDLFAQGKLKRLMVTVPPQHGKAIADTEYIFTTKGWKRHGGLKEGDYVFDGNGKPVKVLEVHEPVFCTEKIYVSGKYGIDDCTYVCHRKHEHIVWEHTCRNGSSKYPEAVETDYMNEVGLYNKDIVLANGKYKPRFFVNKLEFIPKVVKMMDGLRLVRPGKINNTAYRYISKIEHIKNPVYGRCITVEGGEYLVGKKFVLTHNSEGSSRLLPSYLLGKNPELKIALWCYTGEVANGFNKNVQEIIDKEEYSKIFPETKIPSAGTKDGTKNNRRRNTTRTEIIGHEGSIYSVGRNGALTSKTVDILIIDDLYKGMIEANSPIYREQIWSTYTSVADTRLHNDSQIIIVFTRWHEDDIIGRIEKKQKVVVPKSMQEIRDIIENEPKTWIKLNFEALKESEKTELDPRNIGEALYPKKHSVEKLVESRKLDPHGFNCLFQGRPDSKEGQLYSEFRTYEYLPENTLGKKNVTDTADKGDDYLLSICYDVVDENRVFITDVLYTQDPQEKTEPMMPLLLERNKTRSCLIEANNGGEGFARNVKKLVIASRIRCRIEPPYFQSGNKESRILTNAPQVMEHIYMPIDWASRWPLFYEHLTGFKKMFKANAHDEVADVLTKIVEVEFVGRKRSVFQM